MTCPYFHEADAVNLLKTLSYFSDVPVIFLPIHCLKFFQLFLTVSKYFMHHRIQLSRQINRANLTQIFVYSMICIYIFLIRKIKTIHPLIGTLKIILIVFVIISIYIFIIIYNCNFSLVNQLFLALSSF